MSVYTVLFAEGFITTAGATVVWTAPADGATYVLRDVILAAYTGPCTANLQDGASPFILDIDALAAGNSAHLGCRQVILNGQELIVNLSAGAVTYRLTGYRLT